MDRELIESCLSPPLPPEAILLTYSLCDGVTGKPQLRRRTWREHGGAMARQGAQLVASKLDTPTLCYWTTSGGTGVAELTTITAMFFDLDGGEDPAALLAALDDLQIAYLWSESCSSSSDHLKWHLVLPVVSPTLGDAPPPPVTLPLDPALQAQRVAHWSVQYTAVADWLCVLGGLPRVWDKSCKNANRVRFAGSLLSADAEPRKTICKGGRRLLWDALAAALGVPEWAPVLTETGEPAALSLRPASGSRAPVAPGEPDGGPTVGESTGSLLLRAAQAWGTLGPAIGQPVSKYMVLCPWAEEHSTGAQAQGVHDSSTVIMVAGGGGYKCAHAHCVDRTAREYLSLARQKLPAGTLPDRKRWGGLSAAEQAAEMAAMQEQAQRKAAAAKNEEPPAAVTVEGSESSSAESTDNSKVANAAHEVKMSAAPVDVAALAARMAPRLAVLRAVEDAAAPVTPIDRSPKWTHLPALVAAQLQKKPKSGGALKETTSNVIAILSHDDRWTDVLRWNTFTVTMEKALPPPWHRDLQGDLSGAGEWSKSDDRRLVAWLEREYQISMGTDTAGGCAAIVAQAHAYHPVRDYLSSLTWDGVPRLDQWLHTYLGAADTRYSSLVGRMWMISAVARVMQPGSDVHTMLVLEGAQGRGKSQSLRALAPAWFCDTEIAWANKDKYQQIQGIWVYEIAELAGLSKHDESQAKGFLTSPTDRFRAPYDSTVRAWPRSVCFAGSVNPDKARGNTYLKDPTGARRYWPIACFVTRERADVAGLRAAADQLWAEALTAYRSGEQWHPAHADEPLFTAEQQSRNVEMQEDAWDGTIAAWLSATMAGSRALNEQGKAELLPLTPAIILTHAVGVPRERQDQRGLNRVGSALRRLGWRRSERQRFVGRLPCYPWEPDLKGDDADTYAQLVAMGDDVALQQLYRHALTGERLAKALRAAQERRQPVQEELPGV